ncbi:16942_t:CDS:1, partial [Funneliformis geosporum]
FDYIKQIRGSEAYNPTLQEINSTQQKYGRAQGITRKAIDIAIATNSYDEFIGICHGFILDKQRNQELEIEIEDVANIKNPIITTRKGRPAGRAKSIVEVQYQHARKKRHLLKSNESDNTNDSVKEIDKRKTCQNCGNKGHNRVTCM